MSVPAEKSNAERTDDFASRENFADFSALFSRCQQASKIGKSRLLFFSMMVTEVLSSETPQPATVPAPASGETQAAFPQKFSAEKFPARIFYCSRGNGLSLAAAAETVLRGAEKNVPEIALTWAEPLKDSENIRQRKIKTAENLGRAFARADGCLERAAGTLGIRAWSETWQKNAELAAENLIAAAKKLDAAAADWTTVSGLLPLAGTLPALRETVRLVGALLDVRGEDATLISDDSCAEKLEKLCAATALAENCARHKALLSLPYPESASKNPHLEKLLRVWNEAEFSPAFLRGLRRKKVFAALRNLAGTPKRDSADPRVDLGNLIAVRNCEEEFEENFSEIRNAFPGFFADSDFPKTASRLSAIKKARMEVAAMLAKLESVPEKRDAWATVIARWLRGNDPAFAAGGEVENAFAALASALENFRKCVGESEILTGTVLPEKVAEFASATGDFIAELLADRGRWRAVCAWNAAVFSSGRRGMGELVAAVKNRSVPAESAAFVFEVNYCRRWAEAVFAAEPELKKFADGKSVAEFLADVARSRRAAEISPEKGNVPAPENPAKLSENLPVGVPAETAAGENCLADADEIRETSVVFSQ